MKNEQREEIIKAVGDLKTEKKQLENETVKYKNKFADDLKASLGREILETLNSPEVPYENKKSKISHFFDKLFKICK